jgi:hypothetical protein
MHRLRAMGIRDKPTAPASPWQNGFVERLIGSIRRECVDHIIVLGEMHLRRALKSYAEYYNSVRTHQSLNKDAPVTRPIQRIGSIKSHTLLGGLHHQYIRAYLFGTDKSRLHTQVYFSSANSTVSCVRPHEGVEGAGSVACPQTRASRVDDNLAHWRGSFRAPDHRMSITIFGRGD